MCVYHSLSIGVFGLTTGFSSLFRSQINVKMIRYTRTNNNLAEPHFTSELFSERTPRNELIVLRVCSRNIHISIYSLNDVVNYTVSLGLSVSCFMQENRPTHVRHDSHVKTNNERTWKPELVRNHSSQNPQITFYLPLSTVYYN